MYDADATQQFPKNRMYVSGLENVWLLYCEIKLCVCQNQGSFLG